MKEKHYDVGLFPEERLVTQPIDDQTLDRVAQLAQLSLPDEQKPSLKQAMNDVLDLVASLQDVATDDVEPMAHPLSISQPLRSDAVTDVDRSKIIAINAGNKAQSEANDRAKKMWFAGGSLAGHEA